MMVRKFIYPSIIESEEKMYYDLKSFLEDFNLTRKASYKIILAISEAFTNALIHGNSFEQNKNIELRLSANEHFLTADIIDEGDADPENLPDKRPEYSDSESGRGVELIKNLTAKAIWKRNKGNKGLQVSMKFYLVGIGLKKMQI